MKQRIIFSNRKSFFRNKNFKVFPLVFVFTFIMQTFLFSQQNPNVMSKALMDSSKDITIHQEINFKVTPQKVYQALLNSKVFSASTKKSFNVFSDNSAKIDSAVGGTFSVFDGHIIGRILELVPNQRIVEAWRVVDWPAGIYSIAKFEFKANATGTQLTFDHIGFPTGLKEHLSSGWQEHYWDALNNYFQ